MRCGIDGNMGEFFMTVFLASLLSPNSVWGAEQVQGHLTGHDQAEYSLTQLLKGCWMVVKWVGKDKMTKDELTTWERQECHRGRWVQCRTSASDLPWRTHSLLHFQSLSICEKEKMQLGSNSPGSLCSKISSCRQTQPQHPLQTVLGEVWVKGPRFRLHEPQWPYCGLTVFQTC